MTKIQSMRRKFEDLHSLDCGLLKYSTLTPSPALSFVRNLHKSTSAASLIVEITFVEVSITIGAAHRTFEEILAEKPRNAAQIVTLGV